MALHKAVVLARGLGSRMRRSDEAAGLTTGQARVAATGIKALLPIGRPFLDYVLSALADAGYQQVCLVIGPEHQAIRDYYTRDRPPRRLAVSFAVQQEPRGTADAVLAAEAFAGDDEFLVMNSDNYYPTAVLMELRTAGEPTVPLFERETLIRESNIPYERLQSYAIGIVGDDGYLEGIVEKPDAATFAKFGDEAPISMNLWRFSPSIFQACRRVKPSPRGELELPQAVDLLVGKLGGRLRVIRCRTGVLDLSHRSDIAAVVERLRGFEANP